MNRESQITESQRQLLGPEAADELVRNEQWLAARLGPAERTALPAGVDDRLTAAIRRALARPPVRHSRRHDWMIAAAAIVLFGVLVGLFVKFILPNRPVDRPNPLVANPADLRVVAAQKAVDAYVGTVNSCLKPVDKNEAQVQAEIQHMDRLLDSMERAGNAPEGNDNPWNAVASVIDKAGP